MTNISDLLSTIDVVENRPKMLPFGLKIIFALFLIDQAQMKIIEWNIFIFIFQQAFYVYVREMVQ